MSVSDPVPVELLAKDLVLVLEGAFRNNSHLLSPIERSSVDTIVSLPANALRLLARLLERKGPAIRLDEITYPEVEAPEEALRLLLKLGLLMELRHSWTRTEAFTVAELKASLRDSGLPVTGRKKELVDRLMGHHIVPQGRVVVPMVQDVVRRCEWLFFGLPGISRKRFLMERMGLQKWMSYAPSPARCPFESRDELLRYERIFRGQVDSAGLVRELSAVPMNDAEPPNFSLRVLLERRLRKLAEDFERDGEKAEALELYRVLSYFQRRPNAKVQRRMALCLDALGDPAKAAGVCQDGVGDHELSEAVGLARTGRRLARKAGISWRPSRPLLQAPVRRVGVWGNQHGWLGRGVPVERAVMSHLGERRVAWKEGGLWTSLFCLLFFDLLWDSSTGMLPAPCLPGPLDLGRPGFAKARDATFRERLDRIECKDIAGVVHYAFQSKGVRVKGLDWRIAGPEEWMLLVQGLPSKGLRLLMQRLGHLGFRAANGLPDLVIWPGERVRIESAFPRAVGESALLVEIKGPGDQLREEQEGWHHRLLDWGFFVETWRVEELEKAHEDYRRPPPRTTTPCSERSQRPSYLGSSPGGPLFDNRAGPDGV